MNAANKTAVAVSLVIGTSAANAALPTGVPEMFTELAVNFGLVLAAGFTLLTAVQSGPILMKWIKRITNRAS